MLITAISFVVVLGVLIFVHELGHFMTAKAVDIEVPRFSIGFGPRILGFKRGETEYVISLLPLGGYVKMAGMEEMEHIEGGPATVNDTVGAESEQELTEIAQRPHSPRDFESKSLPARALVISAGVIMNALFAFIVFTVSAFVWGVAADPGTTIGNVTDERLTAESAELAQIESGARVTAVNGQPVTTWREMRNALTRARAGENRIEFADREPITFELPADDETKAGIITSFEPAIEYPAEFAEIVADGPAARAGIRPGDRVVSAGGETISTWQQLTAVVERNPGREVPLILERDGQRIETTLTPDARQLESGITVGRMAAVIPYANLDSYLPRERPGLLGGIGAGATQTWDITALTVDFLGGLFTGEHSARNVGGPIMIGQMSGRFARMGLEEFLGFMAILSINLAVLNLLPIPVLDGGHLVFLGIEAVRGKPVSLQNRMRATQVGFVMIILLMIWAMGNDILRVFGI